MSHRHMPEKKFYVVWAGHETGIFDSWTECKIAVEGFPGAKYKSFPSRQQAIEAYRGDPAQQLSVFRQIANRRPQAVNYASIPEIRRESIAVDAACSHNPGPVEYQGVSVDTGERLFHVGPFPGGSNNIGEFLAIVHALAWLDKLGRHDITIYSDSRTAIAWVRNRHARTSIASTPDNAVLLDLVKRAENWLKAHAARNPIIKWNTDKWGEIPADFGRKR